MWVPHTTGSCLSFFLSVILFSNRVGSNDIVNRFNCVIRLCIRLYTSLSVLCHALKQRQTWQCLGVCYWSQSHPWPLPFKSLNVIWERFHLSGLGWWSALVWSLYLQVGERAIQCLPWWREGYATRRLGIALIQGEDNHQVFVFLNGLFAGHSQGLSLKRLGLSW